MICVEKWGKRESGEDFLIAFVQRSPTRGAQLDIAHEIILDLDLRALKFNIFLTIDFI